MGLSSGTIDDTLGSAPSLRNTPGTALDVANSDDPNLMGQVVSQAQNAAAYQQTAIAISGGEGAEDPDDNSFLGGLAKGVEHWAGSVGKVPVLGTALNYLGKGLHEVQRDYRILHIAWSKDPGTAFLATAAIVGGAGLGTLVAPGIGTRIGAFAGAELVGRGLTEVSDQLRQDAELADSPETKISFGRDIANGFGQLPGLHALKNTDAGFGKIISGVTDAATDFTMDPLVLGFKLKTGIKAGELGTLANTMKAADGSRIALAEKIGSDPKTVGYLRHFLNGDVLRLAQSKSMGDLMDRVAPGTKIRNADQVQALWDNPVMGKAYRDAAENIAKIARNSTKEGKREGTAVGTILQHYPQLGGMLGRVELSDGTVIQGLDKTTTAEQVHQRFKEVAADGNMNARMQHASILPTRTLTRKLGSTVSEGLLQAGGGVSSRAGGAAEAQNQLSVVGAIKESGAAPFRAAREFLRREDPTIQHDWLGEEFDATPAQKYGAYQKMQMALRNTGGDIGAAWNGAISQKVRTFSGYMPFTADAKTLGLSTSKFTWRPGGMDPLALQGVYRSMRFGMGVNRARYWTDQFANATSLGQAKRIWAEANVENAIAFGLPEHAEQVIAFKNQLAEVTGGRLSEPSTQYGVGKRQGRDVDTFDGEKDALWSHQAESTFAFPNYNLMRYEMGKLGGMMRSAYTTADMTMASKVVQSVFKPLALLNAGFGFRVAIAEAIPQAMRVGLMQTVRDYVNTTATRKGHLLIADEDYHVAAAAMHALQDARPNTTIGEVLTGARERAGERADSFVESIEGRQVKHIQESDPARYNQLIKTGASPTDWLVKPSGNQAFIQAAKLAGMPLKTTSAGLWHGMNVFLNDPVRRAMAIELILDGQGHIAQGLAATGESGMGYHMDEDPNLRQQIQAYHTMARYKKDSRLQFQDSGDFDVWSPDYVNYDGFLHGALSKVSKERSAQLISADLLREGEEGAIALETNRINDALQGVGDARYLRDATDLRVFDKIRAGRVTAEELATSRVDAIRGITEGEDGFVHSEWLDSLARGEAPALKDVAKIEGRSRPAQIYGPDSVPYIGPNVMQRVINKGFHKVIDPIINHLSRDPMYFNSVFEEYGRVEHLVNSGAMTHADAMQVAKTRGAVSMLPKIHNTALRSQFAQIVRNYLPFYFAQEQALKRSAALVAEHPNAFRQYQLVEHGVSDPGFVQTDANGNKYFLFPSGGVLGDAMMHMGTWFGADMQFGLPVSVKGSMSSLKTVFPEVQMPGVSPIVSLPLNRISSLFPELSPIAKDLIGGAGYQSAIVDQLLPHPLIKNVWRAIDADEKDKQFNNAFITALATASGEGKAPGPSATASEYQDFIDRVKNDTRSLFMTKALLGLVSPLAPQVQIDDGLRDEFLQLVNKKTTEEGESQGYKDAINEFIRTHGNNAVAYTIGKSQATVDGANLPYTSEAMNWLMAPDVQSAMNSPFQAGLAFLTPQEGKTGDIQVIHSEMLRMGLRRNVTPKEFMNKFNIAQGYADITNDQRIHKQQQELYADNPEALRAENAQWSEYIRSKGITNKAWYEDYQSPARTQNALRAYEDLVALTTENKTRIIDGKQVTAPPIFTLTPMWDKVGRLITDYQQHNLLVAKFKGTPDATAEKAKWSDYLDSVEASTPELHAVINGVFRRLDATGVTPNG